VSVQHLHKVYANGKAGDHHEEQSQKLGIHLRFPRAETIVEGVFNFWLKTNTLHIFYILEWGQKAECKLFERINPSPGIFVTVFGLHCFLFSLSEILIICQTVGFVVCPNAANFLKGPSHQIRSA
jgi:hypothetical protein